MPNQKLLDLGADFPRFPDIFEEAPSASSLGFEWRQITLEVFCLPSGETPEYSVDHYVIGVNGGQKVEVNQTVEGKWQNATFYQGTAVLCPIHSRHFFCWDRSIQILSLSLKSDLLRQNASEMFGSEQVELIPHFGIQDGLIHQIALALQAELRSQNSGGRLYAETMANALAMHLLYNYSTHRKRPATCPNDFPHQKARLVIEYIHDNLERELSLKELSAIAQLSQHHFCRVFKQATGLSPHRYVIQQRIERAKLLLRQGRLNIAGVAIACGFTHQSHLHRHFKRLTGLTPRMFLNL